MAKKRFLVTKDSFIGLEYIRAEDKRIVTIETDVDKGGMRPGSNLVEVDEAGNPLTDKKLPRASKAPAAEAADDLA